MLKSKTALQEVSPLYWTTISGGAEDKAKTECQVKVKTDSDQNAKVALECTFSGDKTIEMSGGHNFKTGKTEGEVVIKWTRE